jgi:hypothetical protein
MQPLTLYPGHFADPKHWHNVCDTLEVPRSSTLVNVVLAAPERVVFDSAQMELPLEFDYAKA